MKNDVRMMIPMVGNILVASPFLDNTPFERSVILLLTDDNGFMGIILNKMNQSPRTANSLIESLKDKSAIPLYDGGVVDKDVLFCVHRNKRIKNSLILRDGLYVNGDFPQIEKMALTTANLNQKARFYLGYAGWEEGQLEQEIMDGSWVVTEADTSFIFSRDIGQMWSCALKQMGEPYSIWTQFPFEPLFN